MRIDDFIEHREGCSMCKKEQPKHLQAKGWRKQEKRANALVSARATPNSGAVGMDGDGRAFHKWRVEAKQTSSVSYQLRQYVWDKLVQGAMLAGEEPVLHLEFKTGPADTPTRHIVLRTEFVEGIVEAVGVLPGMTIHRGVCASLMPALTPQAVVVQEEVLPNLQEYLHGKNF